MLTLKMWNNTRGFTVHGTPTAIREVVTMVASGLQVSQPISLHVADEARGATAEATYDTMPRSLASCVDWLIYAVEAQRHGEE